MSTFAFPSQVPDCEHLRKAFGGWGTNVGLIISILANRNAAQCKLIRQIYAEIYGVDLLIPLVKELSSDFERVVLLWALDPAERDAILANEAVKRWPSSNRVLVEIACTRSPHELYLAKRAYEVLFNKSLEEDVACHTTGNFRALLLSLVGSSRYSGDEVDMTRAKSDAKILHEKISKKAYSHDDFILILAIRSKAQINAILNEYKNEFGNEINKDLKADLKGCRFISHRCQFKFKKRKDLSEFLALLRTAVKCLTYPEKYFEKVLRLAINKEGGTDGGVLTRVVTTRAKVDMKTIKDAYQKRNSVPLDRAIVKNTITIGDYEKMLLTLIRNGDA